MRMSIASVFATATLALAAVTIAKPSQAALIDQPMGLRGAAGDLNAVETVQFIWRGRRYCWYDDGWHGPGWYWCGYHWRRGFGWGGPIGWRGWRRPGVRVNRPVVTRPGINRPGVGRPGRPGNRPGVGRPGGNRPGVGRPGGNRPAMGRPGGGRPGAGRAGGGRPGGGRGGGGGGRGGRRGS